MSAAASSSDADDPLRECRAAARRRLRERVGAIIRTIRAPLADVLRDHALVHLPPAAAARLRVVHPSWARTLSSPLFAVAHAAAPRRQSGLFAPDPAGFLSLDAADTIPSPSFAFIPASSELTVLSSSHGIACCFSLLDDAYFVCNPATSSWTGVPAPPSRTWPRPAVVVLFDAGAYNFRGDYALVCAFESAPGSDIYCFALFTSGAGVWWVPDAVAPAEGLVPASGVAAGGTAWWRTSIGTAVGFNLVTGGVEVVMCPGDSGHWEIGSVGNKLHCAVLTGNDVAVFRIDGHGGWEEAARVGVVEVLQTWAQEPMYEESDDDEAEQAEAPEEEPRDDAQEGAEEEPPAIVAVANRVQGQEPGNDAAEEGAEEEQEQPRAIVAVANWVQRFPNYDVRLLPFQGAEVEVVVLSGRHVVAFDTVTRRRRMAALPDPPEGRQWRDAEYVAHTNTLALVAPAVLACEPAGVTEAPEDRAAASSS